MKVAKIAILCAVCFLLCWTVAAYITAHSIPFQVTRVAGPCVVLETSSHTDALKLADILGGVHESR